VCGCVNAAWQPRVSHGTLALRQLHAGAKVKGDALSARAVALDPPRAHGAPLAVAVLRATPEDFVVEEDLGFAPAGSGQHVLLRVRKRNSNTQWVARELARLTGCRPGEVGYAGLKDRRAIAIQWFSVPQPRAPISWSAVRNAEFEVLEAHPHTRKLPRGALAGNRFTVRIGTTPGDGARLADGLALRLADIARRGVPNYFGPQRFGRDGGNLCRAGEDLRRLAPPERGFILSAARSALFNAVLAARVTDGSWEHLEAGDLANLDGRGSVFPVDGADDTLGGRCQRLEIHPTGPLWGEGTPATLGRVLALELRLAAGFPQESALCVAAGMAQERRSLRLAVRELSSEPEAQAVVLKFRLVRGGFATAVLRELIEAPPDADALPDTPAQPGDNST
jgi:tRNA pseudouridine13 synthase